MYRVGTEDTKMEDGLLLSLNDLVGFSAAAKDFEASVVDLFLERDSWKVSHLVLDTGGLLESRLVVVPSHAILDVTSGDRTLRIDLTKEKAEAQQSVGEASLLEDGILSVLPELIFGADEETVTKAFFAVTGSQDAYFSFAAAASSKAVNASEEIGTVIGFIADADTMTASHITVDTGITMPKSQHVLPVSLVKEVGNTDRGTVLAVDKEKLRDSPALEHFEGLDRHWVDRVASYYGLT